MSKTFKQVENSNNSSLNNRETSTSNDVDINQYDWVDDSDVVKSERYDIDGGYILKSNSERNRYFYRESDVEIEDPLVVCLILDVLDYQAEMNHGMTAEDFLNKFDRDYESYIPMMNKIQVQFLSLLNVNETNPRAISVTDRMSIFVAFIECSNILGNTGFDKGQAILAGQKWFKSWQHNQLNTSEYNAEEQQEQGE